MTRLLLVLACLAGGCGEADPASTAAPVSPPPVATPPPRPAPLPDQLQAVVRLAAEGRFEPARSIATRYTQTHPDDGRGFFMVGFTHHKADNHGPAVTSFRRALELSPDYHVTHHFLAESLFFLGDLDDARHHHEMHAAIDPAEPDAQYGLGLIELEMTRLDVAETRFRRAIELFAKMQRSNPRQFAARQADLAECHARLAEVHFARDDYEAARDELVRATAIYPRNISAFYTLSLVLRRLGDDEAADAALQHYEATRDAIISGAGAMRRVLLPIILAAAGCDRGSDTPAEMRAASPIRFTDVTTQTGIDMTWTSGAVPSTQIVEAKGGGVALVDFDDDGDLDVFIPNGATMDAPEQGTGCRLYENLGDMTFRDATASAGLSFNRWGIGVAVGDSVGDGHDDLYVTAYGRNALLRNRGDGTFEDVTDAAGVGGDAWSAAAAFGDLDLDGDLDLYVANYLDFDVANPPPSSSFKGAPVFKGPRGLPPTADVLYENLGDGTFRDVTAGSGCDAVAPAFGLGVVILDFDGDGRPDVYVGNDSTPNFLFRNLDGLRFEDVGVISGLATNVDGAQQSTMGIAIGDASGNGYPDVFTTNFSNDTNTLHVNKGGRFFDDETRRYGVGMLSFPYVGWAAGLYDLDHDGDEDLLLFNGHVYPNATRETMDAEYRQPPLLYAREGGRFVRIADPAAGAWLAEPHCDRGAAFGDLDGDGDVDVVIVELNGPVRVLRNDGGDGSWLIVTLDPPALGSRIEMTAGGVTQTRWVHSGGSFVSASAQWAHFGVPGDAERVSLRITWPDGREQRLDDVPANQQLVVTR